MTGLVIGHRGASAAHPENTLAAFAGAADLGADWVELDVRRSADGVAVVHHDADLPDGAPVADRSASPTLPAVGADARRRARGLPVARPRGQRRDQERSPPPTAPIAPAPRPSRRRGRGHPRGHGRPGRRRRRAPRRRIRPVPHHLVRSRVPRRRASQVDLRHGSARVRHRRRRRALIDATARRRPRRGEPVGPVVDATLVARAHDAGLRVYPWTVDDPDRMRALRRSRRRRHHHQRPRCPAGHRRLSSPCRRSPPTVATVTAVGHGPPRSRHHEVEHRRARSGTAAW